MANIKRCGESNDNFFIQVTGIHRTIISSDSTVATKSHTWHLQDPRSSTIATLKDLCLDSRRQLYLDPECSPLPSKPSGSGGNGLCLERPEDEDSPTCNGFTSKLRASFPADLRNSSEYTPSSIHEFCCESAEPSKHASESLQRFNTVHTQDSTVIEVTDNYSNAGLGSSLQVEGRTLQSKVSILCRTADGLGSQQDSSCHTNGEAGVDANDCSNSRSKASSLAVLHSKRYSDYTSPMECTSDLSGSTSLRVIHARSQCSASDLQLDTSFAAKSLKNSDPVNEIITGAAEGRSTDPEHSVLHDDSMMKESCVASMPILNLADSWSEGIQDLANGSSAKCRGTSFDVPTNKSCSATQFYSEFPRLSGLFDHSSEDMNHRFEQFYSTNISDKGTSESQSKSPCSASSLQNSNATNALITTTAEDWSDDSQDSYDPTALIIDESRFEDDSVPQLTLPNQCSVGSKADCIESEPAVTVLSEPPVRSNESRLESSTLCRKRKFESTNECGHGTNFDVINCVAKRRKMALEKGSLPFETVTIPVAETSEADPSTSASISCQITFTGHEEDSRHFQSCDFVKAGMFTRKEHSMWLSRISINSGMIDSILGNSCRRILLTSECCRVLCIYKHTIDLNFDFPSTQFNANFNMFTKWFLESASNPDFRSLLLMLSRLPQGHNGLMVVFCFAKMMLRLNNSIYKQALATKLVGILVNTLGFEPWEAVRMLLLFSVTSTTNQSEIENLLNILEVAKKSENQRFLTYESLSCLWHVSGVFVCPRNLLFKLIKECLVRMPSDLKLSKDRMVADLMTLPRRVILKNFLFVDKFLVKFYPQNSEVAHRVRSYVLYCADPTSALRTAFYETSRVKGTGLINPKWNHLDLPESNNSSSSVRMRNFLKRSRPHESRPADIPACDLIFENFQDGGCQETASQSKSSLMLEESLIESLHAGKFKEVAETIASSDRNQMEELCGRVLLELGYCKESKLPTVVLEMLRLLRGGTPNKKRALSVFVTLLNSLLMRFYRQGNFKSALKLIKTMVTAGVNYLVHVPKDIDDATFRVICSEVHLACRFYSQAIECLTYDECLNFSKYKTDSKHFHLLERVVISMLKTFLKRRLSLNAVTVFRLILLAQKNLHRPIDIGKFYEGVLFLSFIRSLKRNGCPQGEGANLYVLVDRLCGNYEPFHSTTYRSLLVELHRSEAPEDIIRRTLLVCMKYQIYPDYTVVYSNSLLFNSQFTTEEMSIYLKYYFFHHAVNKDIRILELLPFEVRFIVKCPLTKAFPISNDLMNTPKTLPEAVERLESALQYISGPIYQEMEAEYSSDGVTIPVHGVRALLRELRRRDRADL